jgi:hypothetical protein
MVGDADLMQETVVKSGRAVSSFTTDGDQIGLGTNEGLSASKGSFGARPDEPGSMITSTLSLQCRNDGSIGAPAQRFRFLRARRSLGSLSPQKLAPQFVP